MTQHYPLTVAGAAVVLGPCMGHPHHIPNCFPHAGHVNGETMRVYLAANGGCGQGGTRHGVSGLRRGFDVCQASAVSLAREWAPVETFHDHNENTVGL